MVGNNDLELGEQLVGEVPHEIVGPNIYSERFTDELNNQSLAGFSYRISDMFGRTHIVTPQTADEVVHDPETGHNYFHNKGVRIAIIGGVIGATIATAIATARVIDKKRQS
jgi:hypothetical protein